MFCPLKILHSSCWCKKHHTEVYVQYSFSCLSNWEIWTNLKKQMNACITNFSEVFGNRLSPFSHCHTKRAHFILSCLSDVRFMFDLSKQNTYMTTGPCNIQVNVVINQFSICQTLYHLQKYYFSLGASWDDVDLLSPFRQISDQERNDLKTKVGLWKLLKDPISV